MRAATFTAALAAFATTASASWAITGAVSGIDSSTGARPFRLPVEELATSGPMWDLYVQALQFWQSIDQSNQFSWYQIAGVHGLPNVAWDGATSAGGDSGYYVGYCQHRSIVFPTWHRAYMALYEEVISIYAHQIADSYSGDQKAVYQKAADQLRMPYWDWSTNANIPDIVAQPTVTINAAWGSETVNNPLFRYDFHPYDASALDNIYSNFNWTVRAPTDNGAKTANQQLMANQQQFHDGVYQLFSSQSSYNLFSNTDAPNAPGGYQNIENIHNMVHNSVGGDMVYLWIAAQDPIFFLHHANVDRIFAIWQAIYPDSWMEGSQPNSVGAFDTAPGTQQDQNTGLSPFHKDANGNSFTSNDVRSIKNLGYAYRDIVDWNVTSDQLSKNTVAWANKVYNPSGSSASKRSVHGGSNRRRDAVNMKSATASDNQYVLNIKTDLSKINGSMTMDFSINNQSIGSYPILMGGMTKMDMGNPMANGQMALTHGLLKIGANLADQNGTLATIAKGMSWTGTYGTGQVIQASDLPDGAVTISVATRQVKQTDPEDQFPQYDDWTNIAEGSIGNFASKVLGIDENTIKTVTQGIKNATQGIL